jgi:hypothetical protein
VFAESPYGPGKAARLLPDNRGSRRSAEIAWDNALFVGMINGQAQVLLRSP